MRDLDSKPEGDGLIVLNQGRKADEPEPGLEGNSSRN
jgi:hypothetical protein